MTRDQCQEIVTMELYSEQILHEIDLARETLASEHLISVIVEYGWGSNLDSSSLWQPHEVALNELSDFVAAAERAGIYRVGGADLIVRDAENKCMLLFCHESDVHLKTTSVTLADKVMGDWLSRGITVRKRTESGEWKTSSSRLG